MRKEKYPIIGYNLSHFLFALSFSYFLYENKASSMNEIDYEKAIIETKDKSELISILIVFLLDASGARCRAPRYKVSRNACSAKIRQKVKREKSPWSFAREPARQSSPISGCFFFARQTTKRRTCVRLAIFDFAILCVGLRPR